MITVESSGCELSTRKNENMNDTTAWADRIAAAAKPLGYTPEILTERLAADMGLTHELGIAALDDEDVFKFGDFREAFKHLPIAVLRMAFKALKGGKRQELTSEASAGDPRIEQLRKLGLKVKIEDADPASLLGMYLPEKPSDPVTTALRKRFGDKPVIAFREDGSVAITETLQYVADLEQNYPEQENITVDGKLVKLWPIGTKPNTMVEEDPLFPDQPLRNGYSLVNHRNWSQIPHERRQLCRIILDRGDIDPSNKEAVLRLLERAATDKGLLEAYPEADLEFRERKHRDQLPKLKIVLGSSTTKPNNPFGVRRSY
jgi:hypothetical protein